VSLISETGVVRGLVLTERQDRSYCCKRRSHHRASMEPHGRSSSGGPCPSYRAATGRHHNQIHRQRVDRIGKCINCNRRVCITFKKSLTNGSVCPMDPNGEIEINQGVFVRLGPEY
jgi:hypothetical protein